MWWSAGATGGIALTVLLLAAGAGAAAHATVLSAPYVGTQVGTSHTLSVSGCGGAAMPTPPSFRGHSGLGHFALSARAPSCANPAGSDGYVLASFIANVPIPLHGKSATVTAVIAVTATVQSSVRAGSCVHAVGAYSYCYQSATAFLAGYVWVEDTTNGTFSYAGNYWSGAYSSSYVDDFCSGGNCTKYSAHGGTLTVNTVFALFVNVTSVASHHHYVLVVEFYGDASASTYVYGATLTGGHARAAVDVSGTNSVNLASITIV